MASYDNLMAEQPWLFRSAFSDAWFSDAISKETDQTLTKALHTSYGDVFPPEMLQSLFAKPDTTPVHTPTVSGVSENESLISKNRRSVPPTGRVSKRKSRASKRASATTFIAADPENFMQMVQQVTGARLIGSNERIPVAPVMNPEMHRAGDGLPTLDTSAFLLDGAASSLVPQPSAAAVDGGATASERYFDSLCSFPTLESWEAV